MFTGTPGFHEDFQGFRIRPTLDPVSLIPGLQRQKLNNCISVLYVVGQKDVVELCNVVNEGVVICS